jgi:hypothetical protein
MVYENVVECTEMLDAAGMGAPGKPNTLWAMVKEIIADRARLNEQLNDLVEHQHYLSLAFSEAEKDRDAAQGRERVLRELLTDARGVIVPAKPEDALYGISWACQVGKRIDAALSQPTTPDPRDNQQAKRPPVICLCGSSRFVAQMAVLGWLMEKEGAIVLGLHLLPPGYPTAVPDHLAEAEGVKEHMDELHLRKIDLADRVFVVNKGGYIGESTSREIAYARAHGKPVGFLEPDCAVAALQPEAGRGEEKK